MILIQAVPDNNYFIWQLYVQMYNFRDYGIEKDAVILVAINSIPSERMKVFQKWTKASVYYYEDTRENKQYISSIRPHLLAKHFLVRDTPENYFYHDQDIIFIQTPDLESLNDGSCYVAPEPVNPAHDYLSSKYLKKFHDGYVFSAMCKLVGISEQLVVENDINCGGAQYVLSGCGHEFWAEVEVVSERLYTMLYEITRNDAENKINHVQIWTSDMWALLWCLWKSGKGTVQSPLIDFNWPYEAPTRPIMHNAGITNDNQYEPERPDIDERKKRYFYKSFYNGEKFPFGEDFSYVSDKIAQHFYIKILDRMSALNMEPKRKILGIFSTHNKINQALLAKTLSYVKKAMDYANGNGIVDVEVVTVSWETIPDNPFKSYLSPFRDLGHLNYVLQLKQALVNEQADIVCILEHDVLYPLNYFENIFLNWDYGKYGVWDNNYIGLNETGFLDVVNRHQPFSLFSAAKSYLEMELDKKVNECVKNIGDWNGSAVYGWCYLEPDNKELFKILPFTDDLPAIHVNMNRVAGFGTGSVGKNHHFTNHCEVCYEQDSQGKLYREDWGYSQELFNFI